MAAAACGDLVRRRDVDGEIDLECDFASSSSSSPLVTRMRFAVGKGRILLGWFGGSSLL